MSNLDVLVVDDDRILRENICRHLTEKGYSTRGAASAQMCHQLLTTSHPSLVLMDYDFSDENVFRFVRKITATECISLILMSNPGCAQHPSRETIDSAAGLIYKPIDFVLLCRIVEQISESALKRACAVRTSIRERDLLDPFVGVSDCMSRLRSAVERVVNSDYPIVIQGETGSGKGVLAKWIHERSSRQNAAFVGLNCAGLNRELVESELFGHEKGAFTGAISSKSGLFEVAHHGTLFLDEIGDMDLSVQPKLLKVLEEQRFRRIGDLRERVVDVRLISATNQDLSSLVAKRQFRADLFFRLNIIPLRLPALRERVCDIPALAKRILETSYRRCTQNQLRLGDGVCEALMQYHWPGNIRELRNVLQRAALLSDDGIIRPENIRFQALGGPRPSSFYTESDLTLDELIRHHISQVFIRVNGNVEKASQKLGIPRSTLYAKVKQYSLRSPSNQLN